MWILKFLPRKCISRIAGKIAFFQFFSFIQIKINSAYASYFKIDLSEAELSLDKYPSLGEFFIRKLKTDARPIQSDFCIHPADSVVSQQDEIKNNQLIQAKGITYSVQELIGEKIENGIEVNSKFEDGYFLTYYLSPKDYHRVHSPVTGVITKINYISGDLWPVNQWSVLNIPNVFNLNERVYVEIKTTHGPVGVVFVGATNVGSIKLAKYDIRPSKVNYQLNDLNIPVAIGEELGMFRMGSTIVMLYNKNFYKLQKENMKKYSEVRVGESF